MQSAEKRAERRCRVRWLDVKPSVMTQRELGEHRCRFQSDLDSMQFGLRPDHSN